MDSRKIFENEQPLLFVAPKQGVTDFAFRKTLEAVGGMDAFLSEYIVVADDHSYARKEVRDVLKSWHDNNSKIPLIPQIISGVIPGAVKVVEELLSYGIQSLDVNMGCPTKSAIHRKCGSYQSEHPEEALELALRLRELVPCGLSIKTRIGQKTDSRYLDLLEMLNKSGCDFVTMHCRLATSGYHGEVFPEYAKTASQMLKAPLIYNGGLSDPKQLDAIANKIGARGLMVGRGIMQNPWLFKQVQEFRITGQVSPPNKEEFYTFFENLYNNYREQDCNPDGCVKKMKQLLSAFRHPNEEWKTFLIETRRELDVNAFFGHIKNIKETLLETIGLPTNNYFETIKDS